MIGGDQNDDRWWWSMVIEVINIVVVNGGDCQLNWWQMVGDGKNVEGDQSDDNSSH